MGASDLEQDDIIHEKISDDEELVNPAVRKRLSRKLVASDSDSEETEKTPAHENPRDSPAGGESDIEMDKPVIRKKVFLNSDDSASENGVDSQNFSASENNSSVTRLNQQSSGSNLSGDKAEGSGSSPRRKKYSKKMKKTNKKSEITSADNRELPSWKKALDSGVFSSGDSDSDRERESHVVDEEEDLEDLGAIKKKAQRQDSKKSSKKEKVSHSNKQQQEKRKDDLLKLYSESQKLQRQARVSVPYHKPKQRTLQEFLNMKSLKVTPTHGKSLRMRDEELEPVIKQLKDREKEIEEFFKSDSETEEPEKEGTPPEGPSVLEEDLSGVTKSSASEDRNSQVTESIQTSEAQSQDLFDDGIPQVPAQKLLQTSVPGPGSLDLFPELSSSCETPGENKFTTCQNYELDLVSKTASTSQETLVKPGSSENLDDEKDDDEFSLFVESEIVPKTLTSPDFEQVPVEKRAKNTDAETLTSTRMQALSPKNAGTALTASDETSPKIEVKTCTAACLEPFSSQTETSSVFSNGKASCEKSLGLTATENCWNSPSLELEIESQELVSRPKLSDRKKALGHLPLITPKLSGRPGQDIDLSPPTDDVFELQQRFVKHAAARNSPKKKDIQLNVVKKEVTADGKETLKRDVITFKPDESKDKRANLWQLKGALRKQLDIKRELEMKKLMEERAKEKGENGVEESEENLLDQEEEEELSDRDSLADESEDEKNEFLDGEAEEDEPPEEANEGPEEEDLIEDGRHDQVEEEEESQKSILETSLPLDFPPLPSSQDALMPGLSQLVDKSANQSLDDDALMALCSGNFQTQVPLESQSQLTDASLDRPAKVRKRISLEDIDSDDDTNNEAEEKTPEDVNEVAVPLDLSSDDEFEKKDIKKRKRLVLSDDENDNNEGIEEAESEEEEAADELEDEAEDEEKGDIAYDSDENEIATPLLNGKGKLRKDFLENEAELSGSEAGSDDENEEGLDEYEEDEGDKEVFDQNELRDQVEKIHLKTILDEDQRDIRLFQEFFLEDGELHAEGPGRERRFRWANLGDDDEDNSVRKDSDDELRDEDALDVETWRKERHEREQFITSQSQDDADADIISSADSQLLLLGKKALQKTKSKTGVPSSEEEIVTARSTTSVPDSPDFKKKGMPIKRGSFLSFKEDVLTRLAVITKGNTSVDDAGKHKGGTAKSTCVFATVTPPKPKEAEKRKKEPDAAGSTPKRMKVKQQRPARIDGKGKINSIFSHISTT